MAAFEIKQKVGFQHCDPAGIVFYPRYFEMFNATVEQWFDECVGFSFFDIHMRRAEVVPTVHIDVDFKAPSRLGDELTLGLNLLKVGNSSIDLSVDVSCGGRSRVTAKLVLVYAKNALKKADGWPDDLRTALNKQLMTH